MFPYIEFSWIKIYMIWVWIIFFVLNVIYLVYHYWKKYSLNFWRFFNYLPLFLFFPYVLWKYFFSIVNPNIKIFIPYNLQDFLYIFTPYWYNFYFPWIVVWIFIAIYIFFKWIKIDIEIYKRIDVFFYSISLSLIPLWIFLLLWDNFIWEPTESFLWISAFMVDSQLYNFWNKVYPLWLFVSFIWILSFIIIFSLHYIRKKYWLWIYWFILILLLFNIPFLLQQYPRYFNISLWSLWFDMKNYFTIFMSIFLIYYYKWLLNKWK